MGAASRPAGRDVGCPDTRVRAFSAPEVNHLLGRREALRETNPVNVTVLIRNHAGASTLATWSPSAGRTTAACTSRVGASTSLMELPWSSRHLTNVSQRSGSVLQRRINRRNTSQNSRRGDSNSRPAVYETAALPLSYVGVSRGFRASAARRTPVAPRDSSRGPRLRPWQWYPGETARPCGTGPRSSG